MGRKYFLNARDGVFAEKQKDGISTSSFEDLTGHLVNISFKQTEHGDTIRLYIVNEVDFYIVSMFVRSRQAHAFLLLAQNLDVHQPMRFMMRIINNKDYFQIHQNGGPVRWFYNEDNAHELPTTVQEKRDFLKSKVESEVIPRLQKLLNPYPSHLLYVPAGKGLRGGYFDDFKSDTIKLRKNPEAIEKSFTEKHFGDKRHFG